MRVSLFGFTLALSRTRPPVQPDPARIALADFESLAYADYALRRIRLLHGQTVAELLRSEGHDPDAFTTLLVTGVGYRTASSTAAIATTALADLAANAIRHGCLYVVDPRPLGFSGFSSRATSGFGVALAGLAFGFVSPDGTFSEGLHLIGTGLVPRSDGVREAS